MRQQQQQQQCGSENDLHASSILRVCVPPLPWHLKCELHANSIHTHRLPPFALIHLCAITPCPPPPHLSDSSSINVLHCSHFGGGGGLTVASSTAVV